MSWKPVVVGVDDSQEAAKAAMLGLKVAEAAGTSCHLVTAVPDPWAAAAAAEVPLDIAVLCRELEDLTTQTVHAALADSVSADLTSCHVTRTGRPQKVLETFAHEVGAGLIVLGGKHHATLARWLGGSTAHHVLRKFDVPLLVTGSGPIEVKRVLAAVDLSFAAGPTLEIAQDFTELFDGKLCAVHVVEPLPIGTEVPIPFDAEEMATRTRQRLNRDIWPRLRLPDVEKVLRIGRIAETLSAEATAWKADLLVVGSHGKGWVDRLLLGSTTEQLLNSLPASLLVVPVAPDVSESEQGKDER
jgi:nucleotide-binding universal stress UspA family protein